MNKLKCSVCVCVCGRITDLLTPPSFYGRRQCILLLVEYNLVFHLINIEVVFSNAKCFKFGIKCLSNVFIVQAAGEEVFFGLHGYSVGRYGSLWAASAGDICYTLFSVVSLQ